MKGKGKILYQGGSLSSVLYQNISDLCDMSDDQEKEGDRGRQTETERDVLTLVNMTNMLISLRQ